MKNTTLFLGMLAAGALVLPVMAADETPAAPPAATRPAGPDWTKIQADLKAKYPKEYAEIETLQKTDLNAAMEKFRELARKANVELPRRAFERGGEQRGGEQRGQRQQGGERGARGGERGDRGGRQQGGMTMGGNARAEAEAKIKEKFPAEYGEIEKMRLDSNTKLRELATKAGVELPMTLDEQMADLKAKYPKEVAEIEALRQTDPRAAFQKTRELADKAGITLNFGGGRQQGGGRQMGPGGAPQGDNAAPPPARRVNPAQQVRLLREKFPTEMAEIDKLRETDPGAAGAKTRELMKKLEPAE